MTQSLGAHSSCRSPARLQKAATRTWRPTPLKGPCTHPVQPCQLWHRSQQRAWYSQQARSPQSVMARPTSAEMAKTWCSGAGGREHHSRLVVQDGPPCFTEVARAGPAGGMGCAAVPRNWARLPHLPFFYFTVSARRLRAPPSAKAWVTLRREKHGPGAYGRQPDSHSPAPPDPRTVSSGDAKSTGDRKLQCTHLMPFCRLIRLLSQLRKCKVSWKTTQCLRALGAETGRGEKSCCRSGSVNRGAKDGTAQAHSSFQMRAAGRV